MNRNIEDALRRVARELRGHLAAAKIDSEEEDRVFTLAEDDGLLAWVGHWPYGYRMTAKGYRTLSDTA